MTALQCFDILRRICQRTATKRKARRKTIANTKYMAHTLTKQGRTTVRRPTSYANTLRAAL